MHHHTRWRQFYCPKLTTDVNNPDINFMNSKELTVKIICAHWRTEMAVQNSITKGSAKKNSHWTIYHLLDFAKILYLKS